MHYLIVGLGATGMAVARFLLSKKFEISITDSRENPPGLGEFKQLTSKDYALCNGLYCGEIVIPQEVDCIVLSPGVDRKTPQLIRAQNQGIEVISEIELFARYNTKPVIAITGTNGKSTVTTLIGNILLQANINVAVGGNLGTPAIALLADENDYEYYVLELSSFQLETTSSLQPLVAILLNITPDHMDRYEDFSEYVNTKKRVFKNARAVIFNRDDINTYPDYSLGNHVSFGSSLDYRNGDYGLLHASDGTWLCKSSDKLLNVAKLKILSEHNYLNTLAAIACADVIGLDLDTTLVTCCEFAGLEHRCEVVPTFDQVLWINDSKGTNPDATIAALNGLKANPSGNLIIILGGVSKDADFTSLIEVATKYCSFAVLMGESKFLLYNKIKGRIPCMLANDLPSAIDIARDQAQPGDRVLFSPACASFDLFSNYMERGRKFKEALQT